VAVVLVDALKRDDPPAPQVLPGETEFEMVHGPEDSVRIIPSHYGRRFLYRDQNGRWLPCIATMWRNCQPSPDPQFNWILSRVLVAEF
jgi:hypothetical protein